MQYTKLKDINEYVSISINPMKQPETMFEMYSVPTYETGHPEYLNGNEIGSNKIIVKKNDILLCKINPRINRVWVVADESEHQSIASSEWIVIRSSTYNPEFLAWYFRCPKFKKLMTSEVTGIGGSLTRAQPKAVAEYPVPILSIDEQEKIVDVLNKVNSIIGTRKRELQKLDNLIRARFVEMFEDVEDTCNVGHYIQSLIAGKSLAGEAECENKVLKTGAASFDFFDATQVKYLPVDYKPQAEHLVNKGDIIISRMNTVELTGAAAYVWDVPSKVYLPDRLWKAVLRDGCNPIFVWQMLIQPSTKEQIRRECSGTSGSMKNISKPGMLSINVKKIPIELQNEFALFVKRVDKSKAVIRKSLDETQLLFDSLMQQYFG